MTLHSIHPSHEQPLAPPTEITSEQIRELRSMTDRFGVSLLDMPIRPRTVELLPHHAAAVSEAIQVLTDAGYRLVPGALEQIVKRYDAAETPSCTCGGDGICTVCVIAQLDAERYAR